MGSVLRLAKAAPVLLWGPPGVGKTASVLSEAKAAGLPCEIVIASIREPADFLGLPVVREGGVTYAAPGWAERLAGNGGGVLFFDEVTTAPPAVQAALLRVILDRVVGDLRLPSSVLIVAAANPPELAAGGWDLTPPLANRFIHVQYRLEPLAWAEKFPVYWGNPPAIDEIPEPLWAQARSLVAAFIMRRPDLLLRVPKNLEKAGHAWPSPRTWDFSSRVLALYAISVEKAADDIAGAVGEAAALEFIAWAKNLDLPDPEDLLSTPDTFAISNRTDRDYAVLSSVATAIVSRLDILTSERWLAAWKIFARAAQQGAVDVAAIAVKSVAALADKKPLPLPKEEVKPFLPLLQRS